MSVDKVKTYLQQWDRAKDVLEFPVSSATVQLAAEYWHIPDMPWAVYARLPLRTRGLNAIWMYHCKGLQRCIRQPVAATLPLS